MSFLLQVKKAYLIFSIFFHKLKTIHFFKLGKYIKLHILTKTVSRQKSTDQVILTADGSNTGPTTSSTAGGDN